MYPSLLLAYLGQGARLIDDGPAIIGNVFFNSIPGSRGGGLFWYAVFVEIALKYRDLACRLGSSSSPPFLLQ